MAERVKKGIRIFFGCVIFIAIFALLLNVGGLESGMISDATFTKRTIAECASMIIPVGGLVISDEHQ